VVSVFISVLLAVTAVALVTLLERKILAYSQSRVGPNKVLFKGLVQPLIDGVKLLHKGLRSPQDRRSVLFFLAATLLLVLRVVI
jgi:NADH-quinone oxidoreductase subunit H